MKWPRKQRRQILGAMALVLLALVGAAILETVAIGGEDPDRAAITGEKRELLDAEDTRVAVARLSPIPASGNPRHLLTPVAPEAWPDGLFDHANSSHEFTYSNVWQQDIDGVHLQVFAGFSRYFPECGVVVVVRIPFADAAVGAPGELYFAPDASGALRIESVDEGLFHLSSADGAAYVFDLAAKALLNVERTPIAVNAAGTPYIASLGQPTPPPPCATRQPSESTATAETTVLPE